MTKREVLHFALDRRGRHLIASLGAAPPAEPQRDVPVLEKDDRFESMMNGYLKSLEDREPPDRPAPAERHFIRKKRRAVIFESRHREI
jgi:hypothetical protein